MKTCWWIACGVAWTGAMASAQEQEKAPAPKYRSPVKQQRVEEVLRFLASDEMAGRNSPSPELEKAADYLAGALKAAGVKPAGEKDSFFHRYELPRVRLRNDTLEVTVHGDVDLVLKPGEDVRLWRPCAAIGTATRQSTRSPPWGIRRTSSTSASAR